jgi:hypothetical protein
MLSLFSIKCKNFVKKFFLWLSAGFGPVFMIFMEGRPLKTYAIRIALTYENKV